MGWREVLRGKWSGAVYMGLCDAEGRGRMAQADVAVAALFALPPADRIALARELLANTGRVVAREVDAMAYADDLDPAVNGHRDGWNACRAAMLAATGKHIAGAFETENAASAREEA